MDKFYLILGCITLAIIWRLLHNAGTYFFRKSQSYPDYLQDRYERELKRKMENTEAILKLVRTLIENETMNIIKSNIQLNEPYKMLNIDDDCKKIATSVYDGIDTSILEYLDTLITSTYLQRYIIKESFSVLLSAATVHNNNLRELKNQQE